AGAQGVECQSRAAQSTAAEDDVGLAAVGSACVGAVRSDDDIGEAVPIHVPRPSHAAGGIRTVLEAMQGETAGSQSVERDSRAAQTATPKHDVGFTAVGPASVGAMRP